MAGSCMGADVRRARLETTGRGAGKGDGGEGGREDEERDEDFHEGHRSEGWRGRPRRVVQAGVCQVEAECALAHVAKHD